MEIILGKFAGFCPGVKRAWDLIGNVIRKNSGSVFILGELIHNEQAMEELAKYEVKTIENPGELRGKEGVVIIRAHGEPPKTYKKLTKMKKIKVIDATCPIVKRVQKLAYKLEQEDFKVIVCGEKDHPESKATIGYTQNGKIISSIREAKKVPRAERISVLAQTTFSPSLFKKICQILEKKAKEFKSLETICNFTQLAQEEAKELALRVNLMLVVGGRQSSNTKRLAELTRKVVPTYHIETEKEIKKKWLNGVKKVGLLAGASTPNWVIKKVKKRLEEL